MLGVSGSDTPYTANPFIGFVSSSTNWQAICSSGASPTIQDTGIACDTTSHIFKIITSGSSVKFYIDNILVNTISISLPSSGTLLSPQFGIANTAAQICTAYWGWFYMSCLFS
jgi:hypothetical protein